MASGQVGGGEGVLGAGRESYMFHLTLMYSYVKIIFKSVRQERTLFQCQ